MFDMGSLQIPWVDAFGRPPSHPQHDCSTVCIRERDLQRLSLVQRQYYTVKRDYASCVCLIEVGQFFEALDADADTLHKEVDYSYMGVHRKCGINSANVYGLVDRLVAKGFSVALIEQIKGSGTPASKQARWLYAQMHARAPPFARRRAVASIDGSAARPAPCASPRRRARL